eukprot:g39265.t1
MVGLTSEENAEKLGLYAPEFRRIRGDLFETYKPLEVIGHMQEDRSSRGGDTDKVVLGVLNMGPRPHEVSWLQVKRGQGNLFIVKNDYCRVLVEMKSHLHNENSLQCQRLKGDLMEIYQIMTSMDRSFPRG